MTTENYVDFIDDEYEPDFQPNKVVNPYNMKRTSVKIDNFYDARLYDSDATEGFRVTRSFARKMYNKWLSHVRKTPGWEDFRRPPVLILEEGEREDGSTYVIRKYIPWSQANGFGEKIIRSDAGKNNNIPGNRLPQSRIKGARFGDEDFKAKMFTVAMGKNISQLRNDLKMTQADLAKKINVDTAMIRNIEIGGLITFNSEDVMVKNLAKALNVPSIKYVE